MSNSKFQILIITTLAMIATVLALFLIRQHYPAIIVDIPKFSHQIQTPKTDTATTSQNSESKIPNSLLRPVPFTPQAPTANWDELHNEACEEATALMANAYFSGVKDINLSPAYAEGQISKLVDWENTNLGYNLDTTSAETAQMIEQVYRLQTKLVTNFTADDIKKELTQNHLVIISEYGRLLGNPYYKQPGPIHHMLLIKGFDAEGFITNDSGTKRGLNYPYTFNTIYNAAADWNHDTNNVDLNNKVMIVVWK